MDDGDLIDFQRELTRTFLLCVIRDRACHEDIPSIFRIINSMSYWLAYFSSVPDIYTSAQGRSDITITLDSIFGRKTLSWEIYTDDFQQHKLFAWYQLFYSLCYMDLGFNGESFQRFHKANSQKLCESFLDNTKDLDKLKGSLHKDSSVDETAYYLRVAFKHPQYYREKAEKFDIGDYVKRIEADKAFNELKEDVLTCLLPIMKYEGGICIYNNLFENICKDLIQVSAFRIYDIKSNTDSLYSYKCQNEEFYTVVTETANFDYINNAFKEATEMLESEWTRSMSQ